MVTTTLPLPTDVLRSDGPLRSAKSGRFRLPLPSSPRSKFTFSPRLVLTPATGIANSTPTDDSQSDAENALKFVSTMSDPRNHIISSAISPKEEGSSIEVTVSPPAQVHRSKSRLVRLLTTRKHIRSTSPPSDVPLSPTKPFKRPGPPPVASAFGNKEQRDAALRERGLLPPLPQKDLSQLEREQDRNIPVVKLAADGVGTQAGEGEGMSAADIIKRQWEAKNKTNKTAHIEAPPSPPFKDASGDQLHGEDVNSPSSMEQDPSRVDPPLEPLQQKPDCVPRPTQDQGHKTCITLQVKSLPLLPASPDEAKDVSPVTPILDLPYGAEIQSFLANGSDSAEPPTGPSLALEPSSSSTSSKQSNGSSKSNPRDKAEACPAPTCAAGTIPQSQAAASPAGASPQLSTAASPLPDRTPPLDNTSPDVCPESSTNAGPLRVKIENNAISTIPEDHEVGDDADRVNDVVSEAKGLAAVSSSGHGHGSSSSNESDIPPPVPPRDPPAREKRQRKSVEDTTDASQTTAEQTTARTSSSEAGAAAPTRRKTINPFKRNHTDGAKRSLTTLGRSVVGSVLRPSRGGDKTLPSSPEDGTGSATNTPPSSPTALRWQRPTAVPPPPQPPAPVRQAVSPTLYSSALILAEANNIEDEEQRRMTEMAFMS